ncbi:MAG: hypothetical protein SVT52_05245 [Planctomycetota bacterium]|nr:hypothetical protein [Planctomycetota bacterium]
MRLAGWLVLTVALVSGCTLVDENPNWNPKADYPAWTYDAPFYYRPTEDLKVVETVGSGIPVYYSRSEYFFIRHPGGSQVVGGPRVAVWSSPSRGEQWEKAGYFGVEQSYFMFKAEADGQQWVRFVGPGQGVSEVPPGMPHRVYVVDTHPPVIDVTVTPPPWKDKEKKEPYIYKVGEMIKICWTVTDVNLAPGKVRLGTCFAKFPHNLVWSRFPKALPPADEMEVEIPPEAVRDGGLRFRVEATDKANNVGHGLTEVLQIAGQTNQGPAPTVRPVGPHQLIQQTAGTPGKKLGWPAAGELIRGGTSRVLGWMPKSAKKYETVELHFTANNGLSWRAIAVGLKPGLKVKWSVPAVSSKNCRLRIVGVPKTGEKLMLVMTRSFTVDTVMPPAVTGPEPIAD